MQCTRLSADRNQLAEAMLQCLPLSSAQQNLETMAVNILLEFQIKVVFKIESDRAWQEISFTSVRRKE